MRLMRSLLPAGLVLGVLASPLLAGDPPLALVGSFGVGSISYVQAQGPFVYGHSSIFPYHPNELPSPFSVVGASDPASPSLVGSWLPPHPGRIAHFTVAGSYAYVVAYTAYDDANFATSSALFVLDVSSPAAPTEVAQLECPGLAETTFVSGGRLYAADESVAVTIYSLEDPAHPVQIGGFPLISAGDSSGYTSLLAVSGATLYIGYRSSSGVVGVRLVDAANPAAPATLSSVALGSATMVNALIVGGTHAYVTYHDAQYIDSTSPSRGGYSIFTSWLAVLDLSNPAAPTVLTTVQIAGGGSEGILARLQALRGNTLYVLKITPYGSIWATDVSDPAAPVEGSQIASDSSFVLAPDSDRAYGLGYDGSRRAMHVYDTSTPAAPAPLGTYYPMGGSYDLAIAGTRALVATGEGVYALDLTDPAHPAQLASYPSDAFTYEVKVCGGFALYGDSSGATLHVLDLAPAVPVELDPAPYRAYGLAYDGTHVYTYGDGPSGVGLYVLHLSPSGVVSTVGFASATDFAAVGTDVYLVAAANGYAYGLGLYDTTAKLATIDVTNPSAPHLVSVTQYSYLGRPVLDGRYAYFPGDDGLTVMDLSNPSAPQPVATLAIGPSGSAARWGNYLLVPTWGTSSLGQLLTPAALVLVDISDPLHPREAGRASWWGTAYGVAVARGHAYVADNLLRVFSVGPFTDIPADFWAYDEIKACYDAHIVTGYPDGTFRPKEVITRDLMAAYLARARFGGDDLVPTGPATATFSDVPPSYGFYRHIEYCHDQGMVMGYKDGTYQPTWGVNRGQMAAFLARAMCGGDDLVPSGPATASFTDVPLDFGFYRYIEYIYAAGITTGYSDGTYHPEWACNRDQMAVFVARAFHLLP